MIVNHHHYYLVFAKLVLWRTSLHNSSSRGQVFLYTMTQPLEDKFAKYILFLIPGISGLNIYESSFYTKLSRIICLWKSLKLCLNTWVSRYHQSQIILGAKSSILGLLRTIFPKQHLKKGRSRPFQGRAKRCHVYIIFCEYGLIVKLPQSCNCLSLVIFVQKTIK